MSNPETNTLHEQRRTEFQQAFNGLLTQARLEGFTVELITQPLVPLAMGNYAQAILVHPAKELYR